VSSRAWRYEAAADLVAGHGVIVAEYFDIGRSRRLPWPQRPQAANLLDAIADPGRRFDAIVVGEYERAFAGDQLIQLLPMLDQHRVQVWLPEAGGPINVDDPAHRALILLLGHQSRREILRSGFRTTAAMRAQTRDQGRHLGGRPPYGYRLVDAGSHPNTAHAAWGRRLHRLDVDPLTAPHVRWIFAQRLAGHSTSGIARTLNALGVPSPAAYDRARNRHRSGERWTLRSVAAIPANPRYTGRQILNRQHIDHNETIAGEKATSRGAVYRWNPKDQWVISTGLAHPALVSEEDFVKAQAVTAVATPADGRARRYLLTGLVACKVCGRRADGHWVHDRPSYRCRHGRTSASPAAPGATQGRVLPRGRTPEPSRTSAGKRPAGKRGYGWVVVAAGSHGAVFEVVGDGVPVGLRAVGIRCDEAASWPGRCSGGNTRPLRRRCRGSHPAAPSAPGATVPIPLPDDRGPRDGSSADGVGTHADWRRFRWLR
jgi:site-specific DNA recombinase